MLGSEVIWSPGLLTAAIAVLLPSASSSALALGLPPEKIVSDTGASLTT